MSQLLLFVCLLVVSLFVPVVQLVCNRVCSPVVPHSFVCLFVHLVSASLDSSCRTVFKEVMHVIYVVVRGIVLFFPQWEIGKR